MFIEKGFQEQLLKRLSELEQRLKRIEVAHQQEAQHAKEDGLLEPCDYKIEDALREQQIERMYASADKYRRVEIIRKFSAAGFVPSTLQKLVVQGGAYEERIALARAPGLEDETADALRQDKDLLIRCAYYEHGDEPWGVILKEDPLVSCFKNAEFLERLAIARSKSIIGGLEELIPQIYTWDRVDQQKLCEEEVVEFDRYKFISDLPHSEKEALIIAFCTNKHAIEGNKRDPLDFYGTAGLAWEKLAERLWQAALRWHQKDQDSIVPRITIRTFGVDASTALEALNSLEEGDYLRNDILDSPLKNGAELYKKGLEDKNDMIRFSAASRISYLEPSEVEKLIKQNDSSILDGLMANEKIPPKLLQPLMKVSSSSHDSPFRRQFVERFYEAVPDP